MASFVRTILPVLLLSGGIFACGDPLGPTLGDERLLLFFEDRIEEIDLDSGEQWERLHFSELGADGRELILASVLSDVFFGLHAEGQESRLIRLDLCTMEVEWEMRVGSRTDPRVIDGMQLMGAGLTGVAPGGDIAYLGGRAATDTAWGLVALDVQARRPLSFAGPFRYASTRYAAPTAQHPEGVVVVTARRERRGVHSVYRLHPETLELIDSIPPAQVGLPLVLGWAAAPDGESLYLSSRFTVLRYDPERWEILSTVGVQDDISQLIFSDDGETIMILDGGDRDFPSSGIVQLFNADVQPIGEVDVSTPLGGTPHDAGATNFRYGILTDDGTTAYILSGSGATNLYPYQPPRIIVVDIAAQKFERVLEIETASYPYAEFPKLMVPPDCG